MTKSGNTAVARPNAVALTGSGRRVQSTQRYEVGLGERYPRHVVRGEAECDLATDHRRRSDVVTTCTASPEAPHPPADEVHVDLLGANTAGARRLARTIDASIVSVAPTPAQTPADRPRRIPREWHTSRTLTRQRCHPRAPTAMVQCRPPQPAAEASCSPRRRHQPYGAPFLWPTYVYMATRERRTEGSALIAAFGALPVR